MDWVTIVTIVVVATLLFVVFNLFSGNDASNQATKTANTDNGWIEHDIGGSEKFRTGWTIVPGCADISVAGTSYRLADCLKFIRGASPSSAHLSIVEGSHDGKRTLEIHGHINGSATTGILLGFVPKETNALLFETYRKDMPIAARLVRAAIRSDNSAASVRFHLVGPPKKKREEFLL